MKQKWNIDFENVGLVYPNGKEALSNINLKITEGEFVAIIGLSGAGKTTLLKTINKMSEITSGEIFVGDRSKEAIDVIENAKQKVSVAEQKLHEQKANSENTITLSTEQRNDLLNKLNEQLKSIEVETDKQLAVLSEKLIVMKMEGKKKLQEHLANLKSQMESVKSKFNVDKEQLSNFEGTEDEKSQKFISLKSEFVKTLFEIKKEIYLANFKYKEDARSLKAEISNVQKDSSLKILDAKTKYRYKTKPIDEYYDNLAAAKKELSIVSQNPPYYEISKIKGKLERKYKTKIGMVFQRYNLIYKSSVLQNVLSSRLAQSPWYRGLFGIFTNEEKDIAFKALAQVNMLETSYVRAEDLSGGQMQRVALARTIAQEARIILADEPVGALDPIMAKSVMDSFLHINHVNKQTILINLHHVDLALQYADRIIGVKGGKIVFDDKSEAVDLKKLKQIYGSELEGFDEFQLEEVWRKRKIIKNSLKEVK